VTATPGGDGLTVRPADLLSHAGHVEAIGDHLDLAKKAGQATHPGPGAYGQLCTIVPVMLGALQDKVVDGIDAAGHSLHDTAGRLRAVAEAYDTTDNNNAATLNQIGGAL
jgi:hypothetical protein